jgi:N-acetylmuramoyl-L-alanine amidase
METKPSSSTRLLPEQDCRRTFVHDTGDSGILVTVPRRLILILLTLIFASTHAMIAQTQPPQAPGTAQPEPQPSPPPSSQPATQASPLTPSVPQRTLSVVVLDPAHGGIDQGARGASGIAESDVVLGFARLLRISLEAQGLRVILTRQANENPSFDDRSKLVNAQRGTAFITIHVSSTGQPRTVRVYSLPPAAFPVAAGTSPRSGLLPWDRAQFRFIDQSRRLAELIQIQMAQRFRGSSETPFEAPVRQLRTVGAPAVAIEVSSVSLTDRAPLDQMGPGLADGVARAVAAFRTIYESGGR